MAATLAIGLLILANLRFSSVKLRLLLCDIADSIVLWGGRTAMGHLYQCCTTAWYLTIILLLRLQLRNLFRFLLQFSFQLGNEEILSDVGFLRSFG